MRKTFTLIAFIFACSMGGSLLGQNNWMAIEQSPLFLRYEIPYNWYVGGYMTGRSCNCTSGTINTAPNRDVNMVIYFSDDFDTDSLKKQSVWGYRFQTPSVVETLRTPYFDYKLEHSRWENDKELTVIRLSTTVDGKSYVIYFWGPDHILSEMEATIKHIIQSITPLS